MLLKTFCLKRFDKTIVTKTGSGRPLVNSYNLCTATTCKSVVFPESRYFNAVRFKKEFEEGFEKFLKEKDMEVYHVKTQADYDALMIKLEENGRKWIVGNEPTFFKFWKTYKENTCIGISDKGVTFGNIEHYKKQYPDTPIVEYKAKGDKQMLNPECKHCHKKWHQDSAKYCSWCGNKLVDEPEFKVGDYATFDIPSNKKIAKIDRVNGDKLHGFWYDTKSKDIKDDLYFGSGNKFRHATPEEIAEYEVALTFYKHGRKPFELKRGDVVYLKGYDKNIFLDSGNIYKKHNFIDGDVVLIKTAEEIDEWLGADDDK